MKTDERNIDKRTIKTCKVIETTFKTMLCEEDSSALNVKRITERAEVNRKTFYLHYNCIEDLFQITCDHICDGYYEKLNSAPPEPSDSNEEKEILQIYRSFYEYFTAQDQYVERLLCDPNYSVWADKIISSCAAINRTRRNVLNDMNKEERSLFNNLMAVSLFNTYRQWVGLGKNISVDTLVEFSRKFMFHGMSSIYGDDA